MPLFKRFCLVALLFLASCCKTTVARAEKTQQEETVRVELGAVDSSSAYEVISAIVKANNKGVPVVVTIDSPGGSVMAGWTIIKAMRLSDVPVICVVDGMAASMAFTILQACDVRLSSNYSSFMMHPPSLSIRSGNETELRTEADALRVIWYSLSEFIGSRIKMKGADFREMCKTECWFTPEEALKLNIIDGIKI